MFRLTKEDVSEVRFKLDILIDNPDAEVFPDTEMTTEQREELRNALPTEPGEWTPPEWAVDMIKEEMQDHAVILRETARNARSNGQRGQGLAIDKQAKRFEETFA